MKQSEFEAVVKSFEAMDMDAIIDTLRDLRTQADHSEAKLLTYCVALERSGRWKLFAKSDEQTFEAWLDANDIVKPSRYTNWRQAVEHLGLEMIDVIGVYGAVAAGAAPEDKRQSLVEHMVAKVKQNFGVPLSRQSANYEYNRVCGAPPSKAIGAKTKMQQLEAENRALRAKVRELEYEVKRLRAVVEKGAGKQAHGKHRSQTA